MCVFFLAGASAPNLSNLLLHLRLVILVSPCKSILVPKMCFDNSNNNIDSDSDSDNINDSY